MSSPYLRPVAYRWSAFGYYGRMTKSVLRHVLIGNYVLSDDTTLYSAELSYQLSPDNLFRRILRPFVSTVDLAINGTYQDDVNKNIYEVNPFIFLKWEHFPWDKYLITSFGFGEGVSWASHHPGWEQRTALKAHNDRRLLNYLMFEVAVALPKYPQWQLVYRIHHRSGVFGLYSPGIVGSTAVGVGIRYKFNTV